MKITTWNVNSIRARLERVVAWTRANEPDLLCIQETKVVDDDFPRAEFEEMGYTVAVHGQKTYNGVALLARGELEDVTPGLPGDDSDQQARIIAATMNGVRVLNLYVPNGQEVGSEKFEYKLDWLDRLLDLLTKAHKPKDSLLLCGDFNIAPEDRDVYDPDRWRGKVLFSEPEKEMFQALLNWGLFDALRLLTEDGGLYSWWDYRMGAFGRDRGLRIDHVLVTRPLKERVRQVDVDRDERAGEKPSDHAPVTLVLD